MRNPATATGINPRHTFSGSMRAMCAAEGIVDIDIAELRQRLRERRIVLLFLTMEANVLEQSHSSVAQVGADFFCWFADAITRESDRLTDQFLQPRGHRDGANISRPVCLSAGRDAT